MPASGLLAKSTGGRAPRKQLQSSGHSPAHQFLDHAQRVYTVVRGTPTSCMNPSTIRKFSIHLYCLEPLTPDAEAVGNALLDSYAFTSWGNARNHWPRVDVYAPLNSIEECVEHHRREKKYRQNAAEDLQRQVAATLTIPTHTRVQVMPNSNTEAQDHTSDMVVDAITTLRGREPLPHIVPTWCLASHLWSEDDNYHNYHYRSFIFVVPRACTSWADVERHGIYLVQFDQDVTPAMATTSYDFGIDDEIYLDHLGSAKERKKVFDDPITDWVDISQVDLGPAVQVNRACVLELPNIHEQTLVSLPDEKEGVDGYQSRRRLVPKRWKTLGCTVNLYDAWVQLTGSLSPDCVYRPVVCDLCNQQQEHEVTECEFELDEHFFNQDGQCIACHRTSGSGEI